MYDTLSHLLCDAVLMRLWLQWVLHIWKTAETQLVVIGQEEHIYK